MEHAVKVQREVAKPMPRRRSRAPLIAATLLCIPLLGFCIYSWVARPEFIWGPSEMTVAPDRQEANVRFGMYLLAQRVEAYRKSEGVYPSLLDAIGESLEGVSYAMVSESVFELRASENGKAIVFRSNEPVDVFLGASPVIIQQRR
jgi:hypothetical protein